MTCGGRVAVCVGTRPEAIKMSPVVDALRTSALQPTVIATAQHREMFDQVVTDLGLRVDVDLDLMRPEQSLEELRERATPALRRVLEDLAPDAVLVQGDTTTTLAAATAAHQGGLPVGHVEAGLRSGDLRSPFPEELNRRLVSRVASWHFCPTAGNAQALRAEGVPASAILVTGNTGLDALRSVARRPLGDAHGALLPGPAEPGRLRLLVTLHRRETHGPAQRELCRMLAAVASRPDVEVVFPVHLSPVVRRSVLPELEGHPNVRLLEPLPYVAFVHLLRSCDLVLTDSGGLQEEAPSLDLPVLVARDVTERPEGVAAGCVRLCGTDPARVHADLCALLDDPGARERMARSRNPYGDGHAAGRIVRRLTADLQRGDVSRPRDVPSPAAAFAALSAR